MAGVNNIRRKSNDLREIELVVIAHLTGKPVAANLNEVSEYPANNPLLQTLAELIKEHDGRKEKT